jgi:hypothetical protein
MDEVLMVAWVNKMLVPYVVQVLDHVIPLVILDSYLCHMIGLVFQRIQAHRVEVDY